MLGRAGRGRERPAPGQLVVRAHSDVEVVGTVVVAARSVLRLRGSAIRMEIEVISVTLLAADTAGRYIDSGL